MRKLASPASLRLKQTGCLEYPLFVGPVEFRYAPALYVKKASGLQFALVME